MRAVLAQLQNFTVDGLDLMELLALSAFGKMLRAEYQNRTLPAPEWLNDQLASLDREIVNRRKDELERRLKEIKAQETTLETAAEKRERLANERKQIEEQLTGATK